MMNNKEIAIAFAEGLASSGYEIKRDLDSVWLEKFNDEKQYSSEELYDAWFNQTGGYNQRYSYHGFHIPTGEAWYIIGIDFKGDRVCIPGWPATIAKLSDCEDLQQVEPLTPEELSHRRKRFGTNWI